MKEFQYLLANCTKATGFPTLNLNLLFERSGRLYILFIIIWGIPQLDLLHLLELILYFILWDVGESLHKLIFISYKLSIYENIV